MPLPFNPVQLQTYDITQPSQARMFVLQLANMLTQALTPNGIAALINGSGVINGSALLPGSVTSPDLFLVSTDFGSVAASQTQACLGAAGVSVAIQITAALTLNLTQLSNAIPVYVRVFNSTAGALVFKIAGTNVATTALGVRAVFAS